MGKIWLLRVEAPRHLAREQAIAGGRRLRNNARSSPHGGPIDAAADCCCSRCGWYCRGTLAYKTARRINQELEEVREAMLAEPRPADIPTLRRDPVTGAYRPAKG